MAKLKEKQNKKVGAKDKKMQKLGGVTEENKSDKEIGTKKKGKTQPDKINVFDAFCYWIVRTAEERVKEDLPKNQNEFAALHKVNITTLGRWKKQDDYEVTRLEKIREKLKDQTPDVLEALLKRIKKYGMGYEVELWLAYVEGWDKKKVLEMTGKVEFGDGDIRALIQYLPKEKQKIFYDTITKLLIEAETNRAEGKDTRDNGI